jgi:5-hydroxyisourate hydrolase-like protein (transthyretin family)
MRVLLLGVLAAAFTFTQSATRPQAPAGASLSGRVTTGSGVDTRPVRRARVTLTGGGLTAPRLADTDTKGVFRFDRLPSAAGFKIAVQKPGFVKLDAEATPNAELKMEPAGAIEGIVSDASGDPVWNVVVAALQPQANGKPNTLAETHTDDLGRYRLHSLPAGDYVVSAATDRGYVGALFLMPGEKRPDINSAYYPGVAVIEDAKSVRLSAGRDATGIDITFTPAQPVKDLSAPPPPPRPDATGTGRIAGVVTDGVSGKPIRAAEILLLPAPGQGPRLTNWTRTDSQGRFEYRSLEAQRYTLSFRAKRYISLEYGQQRPGETGTQIQLAEGENYRADVKLPRASALEGALVDEFGDPAPGLVVMLGQNQYVVGRHRLVGGPAGGQILNPPTDDRGHYRVTGVSPGSYYVWALSGVYTDANEVGGFAPTYYPGTEDSGGATPIAIAFGADTTGVSFAMIPARTYSIAGTMVDADGKPVSGRGTIWLLTPDRLKKIDFNIARGQTAPDGTFLLRNVPQGQYTLQGFSPPEPGYKGPFNLGAFPFGWLPIAVGDNDLDGVVLKTTPGTMLRGRFVLEDNAVPPPKAEELHVNAINVEFDSGPVGGGPSPSTTHDDLTFETTRMSGVRRIFVDVRNPRWALQRITLNGQDITDTPVDLRTKDIEDVQVVLTPKVSHVTGAVTDDKGPVADYAVVIFPSDPTKWIDRSRFVTVGRPTQQGRFTVSALPPEDYLAIAIPSVNGLEYYDPDFLQQLRINATVFTLIEGESKTLDLKLKKRP